MAEKPRRIYPRDKVYITSDTEAGIRPINVIDKLPSCQLTDEEFVKAFYARFDARAMVILYVDVFGKSFLFGRLHRRSSYKSWYASMVRIIQKAMGASVDSKEIDY